jgi:hypothetical protein
MSISKKNPLKRDQALNDGQMGEEPRSVAQSSEEKERVKAARRLSKEIE